ncbi:family 10 glycosylhydrolase [Ihubacter massiliensis]|uniref:Family 10 glycosylhydrolase n=1 Tax=Hominibacterium faecale TaxID=2839743 RepID=A0A9J6QJ98_9FIRM|nr:MULTISPECIES: family 10 glycosylhydrolase [Eubacteriales Family XIII. Incertae Sedis]MCO7121962.1 family 10 glycosylhydrolase [Ihubacter massiliensis]MCU7377560.1 family 10 glycosylhydrolase [Hominibacterium faecale]
MKKRVIAIITVCIFGITTILGGLPFNKAEEVSAASNQEVRAVWLAYVDFSSLGMKTNSESTFRSKASAFLDKAKSNNLNTVYFHVRAFDDAAWKSNTFKASKYLTSKSTSGKTAAQTYSFDPLRIMVDLAHQKGMELHAWMNPYRISMDYYLDPALDESTGRIETAVKEVMAYGVDGIHFDDYFYHAKKGYKNPEGKVTTTKEPSAKTQRSNVNKMVRSVYSTVKSIKANAQFGISPQGNIDNCRGAGADVDTWLSSSGYIDYIMPQIYWTDQWGSSGKTNMFTSRIKQWKNLNKNGTTMYIGLASYRTGIKYNDDPGWKKKSTNLADQLNILRSYGCDGYSLFSAKDLYRSGAKTELSNLNKMVKRIPRASVSYNNYNALTVKWNKISGVSGYQIYRATSKNGKYKKIKTAGSGTTSYKNSKLTAGKTYYYKVRAYKGGTTYSFSSVVSKKPKPKTPSISTKAGKRKITVSWKKVSGASGYKVYRATKKSGKYKTVKTIKSSKTRKYTNKKLKKGKRYYYKVRAYKTVKGKRVYSSYSSYSSKKAK